MNTVEVNKLDELMGGAVTERIQKALAEIMQNIIDPNTDAKKTRKVTLELTIKPNANRQSASLTAAVKTSLAPFVPIESGVYIASNDNGESIMYEQTDVMPGQVDLSGKGHIPNVVAFGGRQ